MTSHTDLLTPVHAPHSAQTIAVQLDNVVKTYGSGSGHVTALADVSLQIPARSFTAIMGPSGSGKSTLMHLAAGLDTPTSGTVSLASTPISSMPERQLTRFRRDHVGFVFQAYNLLPQLTVEQNITLPLLLGKRAVDRAWLEHVVSQVGLHDLVHRKPQELSGGQQQRAAIARALVTQPAAVFADEPTGALDSRTARQVLELLRTVASSVNQTVVMVTHDPVAASYADTVVFLADGQLAGHLTSPTVPSITAHMARLGE
ncbi:ABC transporter ATP-binding protein [Paramicrobacterium agarici]|uniref:ABC transporter ATP-binding protein n=1 Tax=Paramicrobacterium agarici TaxID=630514 RepID=UPI001152B685|nr:ABC transporter ATP-binding protein [Microbacterium agarici]TQO23678.1 putative ABC transport system ATP-binding protein [Microbacterium agarici]